MPSCSRVLARGDGEIGGGEGAAKDGLEFGETGEPDGASAADPEATYDPASLALRACALGDARAPAREAAAGGPTPHTDCAGVDTSCLVPAVSPSAKDISSFPAGFSSEFSPKFSCIISCTLGTALIARAGGILLCT